MLTLTWLPESTRKTEATGRKNLHLANRKLDIATRSVSNVPGLVKVNVKELVVPGQNITCLRVDDVGDIA